MASLLDIIQLKGAASLSDVELLSFIIGDGSSEGVELAQQLLESCGGSLAGVCRMELSRLRMCAGIGLKRASRIAATAELGRRMASIESANRVISITSSEDVYSIFRPILAELTHEECWALYLTNSNRVIEYSRISQGGVQSTVVDQRLLIKRALELLSTRIIIVHNHPSGSSSPSEEDIKLTRRVIEAATLFDIDIVDHVIISSTGSTSLKAQGLLK